MRVLSLFLLPLVISVLSFSLSACSKSKQGQLPGEVSVLPQSSDPKADPCSVENVNALFGTLTSKETERDAYSQVTTSSPAKENYRKLYDAEVSYAKEGATVLEKLTACGTKVPDSSIQELKKKVAKSQGNVTYLSDSFPDFK